MTLEHSRNRFNSLNSILSLPHLALSINCKLSKKILGHNVSGFPHVYKMLKSWWIQLLTAIRHKYSNQLGDIKLYKLVVDLSKCYENIPHDDLLNVLKKLPLKNQLSFHQVYKKCLLRFGSYYNTLLNVVTGDGFSRRELKRLQQNSLCSRLSDSFIIVSRCHNYKPPINIRKSDLLAVITALIKSQYIHLPKTSKLQYISTDIGIPQGCNISSLLCNIYLGSKDSDDRVINLIDSKNMPNLLLRWVDDFIFISTSSDDILSMKRILSDGEVFNNAVNIDKCNGLQWINAKFDFDIKGGFVNVKMVPWKDNNLSNIRDSLSLFKSYNVTFMFTFMEQRLIGYIQNKLGHKLFTCTKLNNQQCIIENAYVVMRVASLKLKCCLFSLIDNYGGFVNPKYLVKFVHRLVLFTTQQVSKGGLDTKVTNIKKY